ncbi:MAG: tetratricopeptide repeat protein [Acidobacteria bacterium]|nr:tetratricopeptide repeat protein [Acidobacteriota bacterium]
MIRTVFIFILISSALLHAQEQGDRRQIDVEHYAIEVQLEPENSAIQGRVQARLKILQEISSLPFELNSRVTLTDVVDEQGTRYTSRFEDYENGRIRIQNGKAFKPGAVLNLTFDFQASLEKEEYAFLETPQTEQAMISAEGALLLGEGKWFPSYNLPVDVATLDLKATVPLGFSAVGPGNLERIETAGITETFHWTSALPVGEIPLLVFRYLRQEFSGGATPLQFYLFENYGGDPQPLAHQISSLLGYYTSVYGPLPDPSLTVAQVGNIQLPSTGSRGLVLLEKSLVETKTPATFELARRVARLWWSHPVQMESGRDAWLEEGFSTYAALRFIEVKQPDNFLTELNKLAVQALKYEKRGPVIYGLELRRGSPEYESIVTSKGAWVLYMLRQLVGDERFHTLAAEWHGRALAQAVETRAFVDFVREKTGEDFGWFFLQWVESVGVPEFRVEYKIFKLREGGFRIRGHIGQNLEPFKMPAEITIETKGQPETQKLLIQGKSTTFDFRTESLPLRMVVDPDGKILFDSEARQVSVQVALGEEYRAKGEIAEAIRALEKGRVLNPRSALAHFRLGEIFFEQHNYTSAANSFRDGLNGDLKPNWIETWCYIYLGKIYDVLGERQRALAEYQKAINTKNDYNGAQEEAQKYLKAPYSRPRSSASN